MQVISGSTRLRLFGLRGLPAILAAFAFVVVTMTIMLVAGAFMAMIWGIRKALASLLNLFGAPQTTERVPMMDGRPTIDMRRDENGSWRRE